MAFTDYFYRRLHRQMHPPLRLLLLLLICLLALVLLYETRRGLPVCPEGQFTVQFDQEEDEEQYQTNATNREVEPRLEEDFILAKARSLPASLSETAADGDSDHESLARNFNNFQHFFQLASRHMDSSMHWMDQIGTRLPLMRLSAAEESEAYRVAGAERWLRNQSLAVVAAVRNALPGLTATIDNLLRLCKKFANCTLVFLENDSRDGTRQRLYQLVKSLRESGTSGITAILLGCGRINSPLPCRLKLSYSTGKRHRPGSAEIHRNLVEELERVQLMSALRNQLLAYTYTHLAKNHSLLLSIDPDLHWSNWNLTSILQGLYYFRARPQLDSLCASSYYYYNGKRHVYDPCTLQFQVLEATGHIVNGDIPLDSDERRSDAVLYNGAKVPVKMAACFQGLTFYRMASLYNRRLLYRKALGEWICEHNTLSRRLNQNYIDPNMQLRIRGIKPKNT